MQCLSDESKKKQYDQWGTTAEDLGRGMGGTGGRTGQKTHGFTSQEFHFRSNIDPEELFRKIFGDAEFNANKFTEHEDYADSAYGFGSAQEVNRVQWAEIIFIRKKNSDFHLNKERSATHIYLQASSF